MAHDTELSGRWSIDPAHSRIGFSTRHAMVARVRGAFNDVTGTAELHPHDWRQSNVAVTVRVASIDTRNAARDEHLRSADFFDVENHPEITFTSTGFDEVGEGQFIVAGDLDVRGVRRSISVPLDHLGVERDQTGALRAGFEGSRRIDRRDFGIEWNTPLDSGGVLISDKITLEFELSLVHEG